MQRNNKQDAYDDKEGQEQTAESLTKETWMLKRMSWMST